MKIGQYKVHFRHLRDENKTLCILLDGELGDTVPSISNGEAKLHPKDNFCKAKGRKVSFKKAIAIFGHSERTLLWKEYFKIFPY